MTTRSVGTVNIRANGRGDGNDTEDDELFLENLRQTELAGMGFDELIENVEIQWSMFSWPCLTEFFRCVLYYINNCC